MESSQFFKNKLYFKLYHHSKKYIPYEWLSKRGFGGLSPEKITLFFARAAFWIITVVVVYFMVLIFKTYPDKTPFYLFSLMFVVLSTFLSGLKPVLATIGIIALETYFLFNTEAGNSALYVQVIFFISVSIIVAYLIILGKKSDELKKLREQEKAYARAFTKLHDEHATALWNIKARDEFLSIISHELKTPLTVMLLKLSDMLNSIKNVSLADFSIQQLTDVLENSEQQIRWITSMINDLLDVSLITTGRMGLNLEDTDLVKITKHVQQSFSEVLRGKKYKLRIYAKSAVVGRWDSVKIEQAITNLFSNAIKYGEGKPIEIKITKDGSQAKFVIKDQGVGISQEDQKVIFDLFKRAGSGEYKKGLGIGLFITFQIVKVQGGNIKVSSTLGKGTIFTLELPLNK